MRALRVGLVMLAPTLMVGCHRSKAESATRPEAPSAREQYLILAKELESTGRDNLYDVVHQLRPGWFSRTTRQRSGESNILVYLDDRQIGLASSLARISVQAVERVRYLSPTEAQIRYGQINAGRPAINVESKR